MTRTKLFLIVLAVLSAVIAALPYNANHNAQAPLTYEKPEALYQKANGQ